MTSDKINSENLLAIIGTIGKMSIDAFGIYNLTRKNIEYANHALFDLFGVSQMFDTTSLERFLSQVIPDDQEYVKAEAASLMTAGKIENVEFRAKAGEAIHNVQASAYKLGDFIIACIKDITHSREHENYIINYGAKKNTLLEMVTHNLSGPLLVSKNIIDSLDRVVGQKDIKTISDHVKMIRENTRHCIEIVNEFVEEEHLVSEHIFTKANRFDVIEKIDAVLERYAKGYKDFSFRLKKDSHHIFVSNDDVKFLQIINNLLSNAVKWSASGSTIEVRIEESETDVLVAVSDPGVGIPNEIRPYVFQRNSVASRPGLRGEKSIGMGLYIVKKLAALMQGEVWFDSKTDTGSTFFLRIPKELR